MSIENVLFCDLETTGLDPANDHILEIGMQVVAPNWDVVASFRNVIRRTEDELARMSPEVRAQHERSGLLDEVRRSSFESGSVLESVRAFVINYFPKGRAILAGNSIHFDRKFLDAASPTLASLFHYRMIDVTSIAEALRIFGAPHRAMDDIEQSKTRLREIVEAMR